MFSSLSPNNNNTSLFFIFSRNFLLLFSQKTKKHCAETTITARQNNSVLVMGNRGAGKTLAVERSLSTIHSRWNTDPSDPLVGIVRLYGWEHSPERTAFKEIARQLCKTFHLQFSHGASLGDNITFLRQLLDGLARAHKVAVFLLEEFDMFAGRGKQTVLYNLLDALQMSGVQAVVLGTTVRYDCLDLLEKRVKSRFSHRMVMVLPVNVAQTPSQTQQQEEKDKDEASPSSPGLNATSSSSSLTGTSSSELVREGALDVLRQMLSLPAAYPDQQHAEVHNAAVEIVIQHPSTIPALTEFMFVRNKLTDLQVFAESILADSDCAYQGLLQPTAISQACLPAQSGIETYISQLCILDLIVLVAAHRASRRLNDEPINFEQMYKEFALFSNSGDHVDNYTKTAALKGYYTLLELRMLAPAKSKAEVRVSAGSHFVPMRVQVTMAELKNGIHRHAYCPMKLREWAVREGGPMTTAVSLY